MSFIIRQNISKHPTTKNNRKVVATFHSLDNPNDPDGELRLVIRVFEVDKHDNPIKGSDKLYNTSTLDGYVSNDGNPKGKKDKGVVKKKDYYKNLAPDKNTNVKSPVDQFIDMLKKEIDELDKANFFNT